MPTTTVATGAPLVPSGSRIVLVVSKGPSPAAPGAFVDVPDVAGKPQGDALERLQRAGLPVQVFNDYSDRVRRGSVVAQLPPAGASVSAGSQAVLLVSSGPAKVSTAPVVLPDVTGMTEAQAVSEIQAAGLSPQLVHEHSRTVPDGIVIVQVPSRASLATQPRKGVAPWVWVAGALAVVAVVAALFLLLGRESATVPDVTGMTQEQATAAITGAGLTLGSVEGTESADAAEGTVVSQDPAAGAEVREGSAVAIVVSGGPAPVEVPDVVKLNQAQATSALEEAGFQVKVERRSDALVEKGAVIEQTPRAGEKAEPGSTVTIVVSEGREPAEVTMPDVVGLTRVDAERALRDLGLAISVGQGSSDSVPVDVVISQLPEAGERLAEGARVAIVISTGAAPADAVEVPNVVGVGLATAEQTLADAGLQAVPASAGGTGDPANRVVAQIPAAKSKAPRGSAVVVFYSTGQ